MIIRLEHTEGNDGIHLYAWPGRGEKLQLIGAMEECEETVP